MYTLMAVYVHICYFIELRINSYTNPYNLPLRCPVVSLGAVWFNTNVSRNIWCSKQVIKQCVATLVCPMDFSLLTSTILQQKTRLFAFLWLLNVLNILYHMAKTLSNGVLFFTSQTTTNI